MSIANLFRDNWAERRLAGVTRNIIDLEEVKLMMIGLPRDAEGFATLERKIADKIDILRQLRDAWSSPDLPTQPNQ